MDNNKIFEKVKIKIAISNVKKEDIVMKKSKLHMGKFIGIAAGVIISMTGVVVATNYNKIINYFGLGKGIDTAVKNGYIESPNMDYISSIATIANEENTLTLNNIQTNVKIDNFLMDDLNLSVNFIFEFDKAINETVNLKNIKSIDLMDLIVTDEENRIIYCMTTKEVFDEYCKKHNLPYVFGEFNENYMNNGLNNFITYNDSTNNKVSLNYNMYADGYPKSKTLKFNFSKILIREVDEKNTILTGDWNINVPVPEKMYNRKNVAYKVVSCSNENFNITNAFATDTGFEIGIIIDNVEKPENFHQVLNEEIQKEINEGKITESEINERKNTLLRTPKYQNLISQLKPIKDTPHTELETKNIEETSYVENDRGEKFVKSLSPSRRQNSNFIYGNKFSYYETFELTKYDITNKLKVQIMFKGEPIIIELEKNT